MYRTYSQADILLILKNDYFCTDETIYKDLQLEYKINKWNHKTNELERDWSVDTYDLEDWDNDSFCFEGKDFKMANKAAGFGDSVNATPKGYTWHHDEDGMTMRLIPTDLHRAIGHDGGEKVIQQLLASFLE